MAGTIESTPRPHVQVVDTTQETKKKKKKKKKRALEESKHVESSAAVQPSKKQKTAVAETNGIDNAFSKEKKKKKNSSLGGDNQKTASKLATASTKGTSHTPSPTTNGHPAPTAEAISKKEKKNKKNANKLAAASMNGTAHKSTHKPSATTNGHPAPMAEVLAEASTEKTEKEKKKKKKKKTQESGSTQTLRRSPRLSPHISASSALSVPTFTLDDKEASVEKTDKGKKKKKKKKQEVVNNNTQHTLRLSPHISASSSLSVPAFNLDDKAAKKQKVDESSQEKQTKAKKSKPTALNSDYHQAAEITAMTETEVKDYRDKKAITVSGNKVPRPILTFAQTGLPPELLACTATFTSPSPIQSQAWPALLQGRDVVGIAETGSGKTLAFFLPALRLVRTLPALVKGKVDKQGPYVLILSPTRELAVQTHEVCEDAGKSCQVSSVVIYGGMPKQAQISGIRKGVHVITATPGRLLGLMREGLLSLGQVKYLVLDEADRMLDMGFEPDIRAIVAAVTSERQTLLFSATWPKSIQALASEFVKDPVHITIGERDTLTANKRITQTVEVIDEFKRNAKLLTLLRQMHKKGNRIIIFVLYKKEVGRVESFLYNQGYAVGGISSDKSQAERNAALQQFRE
eukprot:g45753.t1